MSAPSNQPEPNIDQILADRRRESDEKANAKIGKSRSSRKRAASSMPLEMASSQEQIEKPKRTPTRSASSGRTRSVSKLDARSAQAQDKTTRKSPAAPRQSERRSGSARSSSGDDPIQGLLALSFRVIIVFAILIGAGIISQLFK